MAFDLIKKIFTGGEWGIAYKEKDNDAFHLIDLPKGVWAADPMLFQYRNTHYLFAEVYVKKEKKAGIGYFVFEDGVPIFKGIVIESNYHMSYPCVFEFDGALYMIPETSANRTIELYKATRFPDEWVKESVLLTDCNYVDSTVYSLDGTLNMLTYGKIKTGWVLKRYKLDLRNKALFENESKTFETNTGRPAGYLIKQSNYFIRPAQDCSKKYGEKILFYKINSFEPLSEEMISKKGVSDIVLPIKAQRIHTYNEDDTFCVVDFFIEKFELFHAYEVFKRSHSFKRK